MSCLCQLGNRYWPFLPEEGPPKVDSNVQSTNLTSYGRQSCASESAFLISAFWVQVPRGATFLRLGKEGRFRNRDFG
jgi:hypothetical protein